MTDYIFVSVQQSSFYGYAGMLPKKFTQAVMVGESKWSCFIVLFINKICLSFLAIDFVILYTFTKIDKHCKSNRKL